MVEIFVDVYTTGRHRTQLSNRGNVRHFFDPQHISKLRGSALKNNEDVLDAVVCLYIAALYQSGHLQKIFGDVAEGYVVVPDCATYRS